MPEIPRSREVNIPPHVAELDQLNRESWYMTDDHQAFHVDMSVQSAGKPRMMANKFHEDEKELVEAARIANRLITYPIPGNRFELAGNMSTAINVKGGKEEPYGPSDLPSEARLANARENMDTFLGQLNIDPANVRVLFPDRDYETPLEVVNVDEDPTTYNGVEPARLTKRGDMIYSYNPNIVFGVRPADCPLVIATADTPKGQVNIMVHFAWEGAANDQISDMAREFANLGVDLSTAKIYLTPGGHAETFPYENAPQDPNDKYPDAKGLFQNVTSHEKDGQTKYDFMIDTPNFVYQGLLNMGLDPHQIFVDTSDTTAPESGYASHSRAMRLDDDNARDFVVARFDGK